MNHSIQVGVKYGGEDVPGSPFEMSSNADTIDDNKGSIEIKTFLMIDPSSSILRKPRKEFRQD